MAWAEVLGSVARAEAPGSVAWRVAIVVSEAPAGRFSKRPYGFGGPL
ncbi:hypothetical protein SAMN05444515_103127 [Ectothiorhodospira marina]|uniref:Uncharacterized protein n=1 Tax=Ectothiorhodospira marina TaxID=1396821 RepID=A0A1H7IJZ8_9GAMM|nr:hypothetical protein SAMN05444515_103127 [Ectothiorhodospira marina]